MKFRYQITEKSGGLGGRSFIVTMSVSLGEAEQALRSSYGFYSRIDVGERYNETKGVSSIGDIQLDQLIGRPAEFKFSSIQKADDFVIAVKSGLSNVREQIDGTLSAVARLGKEFEIEI